MTGREKIEAALSAQGSPEIAAVIPYEGIFIRDHWSQVTAAPWWSERSADVAQQMAWRRDAIGKVGQDWFNLPLGHSREMRSRMAFEIRGGQVYCVDRQTGDAQALARPEVGGWTAHGGVESLQPEHLPDTPAELDQAIPLGPEPDLAAIRRNGSLDLAEALLGEFPGLCPLWHVGSPLWTTYSVWGFEGLMTMVASRPAAVRYACERYLQRVLRSVHLAAALGVRAIWIEECMTDMVSPRTFAELNAPYVRRIVEGIRAAGMKSIYYYCGDPAGKWEQILAVGADALALEESKKGFTIDIEEVVDRVRGQCTVLGNLDTIGVLQDGSEADLRSEIARQIAAGRRNGDRFIMSLGSPVTPGTPVERVRLYCDLVHELGAR